MKDKRGLDWFQLDVTLSINIEALEGVHGHTGFAVWVKLLQDIYKTGDDLCLTEITTPALARRYNINIDMLCSIVETCLNVGIFDKEAYQSTKQLTSESIKRRMDSVNQTREKAKARIANFRQKPQKTTASEDVTRYIDEKRAKLGACNALHMPKTEDVTRYMPTEKRREEKSRVEVCTPTPTETSTVVIPHTHTIKSTSDKNTAFTPESLAMPASLDCAELRAAWAQWCEHASDLKLTLTRTSAQLQLAQVLELGVERFCKAVEHSIISGWKTIHEDRGGCSPPTRNTQLSRLEAQEAMLDAIIAAEENQ